MNQQAEIISTALALPEPTTLATMFQKPDQIADLISRIEAEARAHAPDISTKKGRDAIASLAHKVARSKTALDSAGKDLNADLRAKINVVDQERRKIRDRLDTLKAEVRKPLDDWEAAEAARVEAIKARLERLTHAAPAEDTSEAISALIARVEATSIDDSWQEYLHFAAKAKDATLARLRDMLATTQRREAEAAELEHLRAEALAREEEDRKRQEAELAEQARVAAENAEAERAARIEAEKQEAARIASEQAEARAKAEAERVKREYEEKAEAEAKAAAEREAEYKRNIAAEAAKAEAAAQRERDRIEAERKAEADARAKREADAAHRARIRDDIATSMNGFTDEVSAVMIADAIIAGQIPHVKPVL